MSCESLSNLSETNQKETAVEIEQKSNTGYSPKLRVNWREAAIRAVQIELCDYAHILDFKPKYILDEESYCFDLLVIKKAPTRTIPKILLAFSRLTTYLKLKDSPLL